MKITIYFNLFVLWMFFVCLSNFSETTLSLTSKPEKIIFKLCEYANNTCLNDVLVHKYVIFNSERIQNVTVTLGDLQERLILNKDRKYISRIYAERRAYLAPSSSNEIKINAICEFIYEDKDLPYLDDTFCCRIELYVGENTPNPFSICELRIIPKPIFCFTPLKFKSSNFINGKTFPLIAKIYRKKSGSCDHDPSPQMIYSIAPPLPISFTTNLPVIWKLATTSQPKILIGVPLHSVNFDENLVIPVRLISDEAGLNNQIIRIQCALSQYLQLYSVVPNHPDVSIVNEFKFSNNHEYYVNLQLKVTPRLDQQIMFLNVSTFSPNSGDTDNIDAVKLQCCIDPSKSVRHEQSVCSDSRDVVIRLKPSYSIPMIPAVNTSIDLLSIYSTPTVAFQWNLIKVYAILNYRDKSVTDITNKIKIVSVDGGYLSLPNNNEHLKDIDMSYQTFLNPWSMQLSFDKAVQTIIAPVRVWRSDFWKLMLSDSVLQPIKNWAVPESSSENGICVSRYKVVQLRILCRLYIIEETGEKRYIGEDSNSKHIPYIDVTSMTLLSQLSFTNVISIRKSSDQDHFLIVANQVDQKSNIELKSKDSNSILASTVIKVDSRILYVTDLIIHCIDALLLAHQNRSIESIDRPNDHESITVSLTSNSPSNPCYLVVFVVFSDNSIERISSVNHNQYRLLITWYESGRVFGTPVNDSQLVKVRHLPHVNMSFYEPTLCKESRLIFSKRISWSTVEPINSINSAPAPSTSRHTTFRPYKNDSFRQVIDQPILPSINIVHISIYICTGIVAFCSISFVFYKLFCSRKRSHNNGSVTGNYQRSGSGFMEDSNIKTAIRSSNSKNFSALGKCSTNCLRQNTNKTHNSEPYPPLLPPPGPIATNYDLAIIDAVCNDSAVDSGVELGKLSSYSSNTCPSNDICCTMDLYPSCSGTDDSLMHQQYQSPQFANPMVSFYPKKAIMESDNSFHDSVMLASLNSTKTISNLRHPYW